MWEPWIGQHYSERRTLLLAESCYDWDADGVSHKPQPDHPTFIVRDAIEALNETSNRTSPTMLKLTRAICGCGDPTSQQASDAWRRFAFTNYVPTSVGHGASCRPSPKAWRHAAKEWPDLLNKLRPRNVIVLGKKMWCHMPEAQKIIDGNVQGYVLEGGNVAMCFATSHPSRGPGWKEYADFVAKADRERQYGE
jgi:hypothetical protein